MNIFFAMLIASVFSTVSGTVVLNNTNYSSNYIMPYATVELIPEGGNYVMTAETDENGTFVFDEIKSGDYTLSVSSEGYDEVRMPVTIRGGVIDLGFISLDEEAGFDEYAANALTGMDE